MTYVRRDFTQKKANSYGVTGWVRNTSDGKVSILPPSKELTATAKSQIQVEGEAQGEQSALDKLKKDLNNGPPAAHVVKLETRDISSKEGESEFRA